MDMMTLTAVRASEERVIAALAALEGVVRGAKQEVLEELNRVEGALTKRIEAADHNVNALLTHLGGRLTR